MYDGPYELLLKVIDPYIFQWEKSFGVRCSKCHIIMLDKVNTRYIAEKCIMTNI